MNIKNLSMHRGGGRYGKRRWCCGYDLPVKSVAMCLGTVLMVRGIVGGWSTFFADQGHSAAFPLLIGPTIVAYAGIDLAIAICALVGVVGAARDQPRPIHVASRLGILLSIASAVDGIVNLVFSVLARSAYLEQCVGSGNDSGDMMGDCEGEWNVDIAATVVAWVGNLVINLVFTRLLILHKREIFNDITDSSPTLPLRHDPQIMASATVASLIPSETQSSPVHEHLETEQQVRSPAARSVEDKQNVRMEMESIRTEMTTVEITKPPLVRNSEFRSPRRNAEMSKLESPRLVDRDSGVFMQIPLTPPIPMSVPMPTPISIPNLTPTLGPHQETSSPKPVPSWYNPLDNPASTSRPRPAARAVRSHSSVMGPRAPHQAPHQASSPTYQPRLGNVGVGWDAKRGTGTRRDSGV